MFTVVWLAAVWTYVSSMRIIDRQHIPDVRNIPSVTEPERLAEGERLAKVFGCYDGCHGDRMQGQVLYEHPLNGRLVAPNLTRSVQELTLQELEAIARQGVRPDGTSVFGMPSASLASMTDSDLGAILGFIREYPAQPENPGLHDFGLLTRFQIVREDLPAQAELRVHQPWRDTFRDNEARLGEYLASVACSQCHGLDLEGMPGGAPSLDKLHDYDRFEFVALMERGVAPGDREVGLMTQAARKRFVHLTEEEVDALYVYLKTRP